MQFSKFQNYITGINRSGSTKSHMIDKIAGCFTNNVTKYWCTAILAKHLDKDVVTLSTESKLRNLLNRSSDQVVLEIFKMVELENKHVGQYREDSLKDHPMTVPGHKYVMTFEKYTMTDIFPDNLLGQAVDTVNGKLDDLEAFLKDVILQDPNTEYAFEAMDVLEAIKFSIVKGLNESIVKYSNVTHVSVADAANSEFGYLLDDGWKFGVYKVTGNSTRLQIRKGGMLLFDFSPPYNRGINMHVELTKDTVENAIKYIHKYIIK